VPPPASEAGVISAAERQRLARVYLDAPDQTNDPRVQAMVQAEIQRIKRAFAKLTRTIPVVFTDHDPYGSYDEMRADVIANRRLMIYKGGSDTPLWDPLTNWQARALHDWDHLGAGDFTMEGEHGVYRKSAAATPGLAPLYLSEIVLQAAVQTTTGEFTEQKLVLPSEAMVREIDSLRGPTGRESAAALVWVVAGWLRFMSPQEVMVHLKHRGLDLDTALLILDAATMLTTQQL
jgi:hypothetical protein